MLQLVYPLLPLFLKSEFRMISLDGIKSFPTSPKFPYACQLSFVGRTPYFQKAFFLESYFQVSGLIVFVIPHWRLILDEMSQGCFDSL